MNKTTSQIRVNELIPMLTAISDRSWEQFKELEKTFVNQHGVEVWQEVFNFRLKPALDR